MHCKHGSLMCAFEYKNEHLCSVNLCVISVNINMLEYLPVSVVTRIRLGLFRSATALEVVRSGASVL